MDAAIKTELEKLNKTVFDFKEMHDKEIKEIKDNGKADPLTTEMVDKANKAIGDLQDNVKALTAKADALETIANRPNSGGEGKKGEADIRAAAKQFFNVITEGKAHDVSAEQVKEYEGFRNSFNKYLRSSPGSKDMLNIQNSMSVGSNPDGGFWAPTEMLTTIVTRLFETSPMRQLATVITTSAAEVEFPKDVNTGVSGGWTGETQADAITATPGVGMQKIATHEQRAEPQVTQKFLDDAAINIETWLSNKIADIITRTENAAFVNGDGVAQPRGILSYGTAATTSDDAAPRAWGILQYVATGASAGFPLISGLVADDANALVDLIYKIKPAYRSGSSWIMNRNTMAMIRKLRDARGQYLWQPSLVAGSPDMLLSYPVVDAQDMPDPASNSFSVAFGNFKEGYMIVDRIGLRVLRDPFTSKPFVKFYTTKRVGGDVTNFDAIKLLKFAAS